MICPRYMIIAVVLAGCAILLAHSAWAEIGQIKNVSGQVFLLRNNVQRPAKAGDLVEQADVLTTGSDGSIGITFIDNSRFSAGPNSRIELTQFRFNPTTQEGEFTTGMQRGTLAIVSGQMAKRSPEAMKVVTPTTILGVRGTTFAVKVDE
ncbi:MAG TPA: FecR domain-containing protein [Methylomirabilota bacterium]|nr:FecR domain-containing protein [Methylomirabilota bacterium]